MVRTSRVAVAVIAFYAVAVSPIGDSSDTTSATRKPRNWLRSQASVHARNRRRLAAIVNQKMPRNVESNRFWWNQQKRSTQTAFFPNWGHDYAFGFFPGDFFTLGFAVVASFASLSSSSLAHVDVGLPAMNAAESSIARSLSVCRIINRPSLATPSNARRPLGIFLFP